MERLTTHDPDRQLVVCSANYKSWNEIYDRLAAYEDAGLTPEEIEELLERIAEVGKTLDDLIDYAQKNADESREAERRYLNDDFIVNRYTWMHNVKCIHERYVARLDDIAAKLPAPPKGVE